MKHQVERSKWFLTSLAQSRILIGFYYFALTKLHLKKLICDVSLNQFFRFDATIELTYITI